MFCICRETNHDSSNVQPIAQSLYQLRYPGSLLYYYNSTLLILLAAALVLRARSFVQHGGIHLHIYSFIFFVSLDSPNSHLSPSLLLSVLFSCHSIHTTPISGHTTLLFSCHSIHTTPISGHTTLFQASDYTAVL
jgi:hypothetical protein